MLLPLLPTKPQNQRCSLLCTTPVLRRPPSSWMMLVLVTSIIVAMMITTTMMEESVNNNGSFTVTAASFLYVARSSTSSSNDSRRRIRFLSRSTTTTKGRRTEPAAAAVAADADDSDNSFSREAGETALDQVQRLGQGLSTASRKLKSEEYFGEGGIYDITKQQLLNEKNTDNDTAEQKEKQVWEALTSLEYDMQLLDRLTGQKNQLSTLELTLLSSAVLSSLCSPLLIGSITEFVSPCAAAFTAAIGIAAEYTGKVAVADGKEVAAASIQCAAESEAFLANAERSKAITPLCVGVGAVSATLALLVPVLLDAANIQNLIITTEIYLLCPLVSILAAAVAGLAVQETRNFCNQAIGVGNRRFARSGIVGRTWLSSTELIDRKSQSSQSKWKSFSWSVLPAPLLGAIVPGALPTKTIVVAALAAAESAYYLAESEFLLARAMDVVALKARSAAVCDSYANQGARSAAILPFTSALSGLCAAATAAIVELPFVEKLATMGTLGTTLQACTISIFPFFSALFAAAASVSKARCQVDAEAAMQAASTLALPYTDERDDPVLRPLKGVRELVRIVIRNNIQDPLRRWIQSLRNFNLLQILRSRKRKRRRSNNKAGKKSSSTSSSVPAAT